MGINRAVCSLKTNKRIKISSLSHLREFSLPARRLQQQTSQTGGTVHVETLNKPPSICGTRRV